MTRASSGDCCALPACSTGKIAQAGAAQAGRVDALTLAAGCALEAAVVGELRDERADVRDACARSGRGTGRGPPAPCCSPPSRCSSTEQPEPAGMDALRHLRQLLRVAERARGCARRAHGDGVRQRHLAGFVDEQIVEPPLHPLAREEPRRAGDELRVCRLALLVLCRVLDEAAARKRRLVLVAALLEPVERSRSRRARRDSTSCEQVVDRLVARRGDADALAGGDERHDQARAGPRLARTGRALDEQIAGVERSDERLLRGEIERLKRRAGGASAQARQIAREERLDGRDSQDAARSTASATRPIASRCALLSSGCPADERGRQRFARAS